MGWIEINDDTVKRLHIHHLYKCLSYGSISEIIGSDGVKFDAYLDNPYGNGCRHKKRFTVHTHGEAVLLLVQKKLTIDCYISFGLGQSPMPDLSPLGNE